MATTRETVISLEDKSAPVTAPILARETIGGPVETNVNTARLTAATATVANVSASPVMLTIAAVVTLIVPVLQLVVGWRYADQCPINSKIPRYLWIAGAVGIVSAVLGQLRNYLSGKKAKSSDEVPNRKAAMTAAVAVNSPATGALTAVSYVLNIFLLVWFVFGCIWIFGVWNQVRYDSPTHPAFCLALVYRFAYIVIAIPIVFLCFFCCCCPLLIASTAVVASFVSKA